MYIQVERHIQESRCHFHGVQVKLVLWSDVLQQYREIIARTQIPQDNLIGRCDRGSNDGNRLMLGKPADLTNSGWHEELDLLIDGGTESTENKAKDIGHLFDPVHNVVGPLALLAHGGEQFSLVIGSVTDGTEGHIRMSREDLL
jgi:hypothetical protein